jgi:hypothetical protein
MKVHKLGASIAVLALVSTMGVGCATRKQLEQAQASATRSEDAARRAEAAVSRCESAAASCSGGMRK